MAPPYQNVGVAAFGQTHISETPHNVQSLLPEFEASLDESVPLRIRELTKKLGVFYKSKFSDVPPESQQLTFYTAGYDKGSFMGKLFEVNVPRGTPTPREINCNDYGVTFGGDAGIVESLASAIQPAVIGMDIEGYINIARTLIETTIRIQRIAFIPQTVGGSINILSITHREGLRDIQ